MSTLPSEKTNEKQGEEEEDNKIIKAYKKVG